MNVFELEASLGLNKSEYDKGLNDAEKKGESAGSKIASGLGKAAAAAGVAIGAAATAIGALAAQSVKGYAEQEQLIGGIQKLYGNMGMSLEDYAKANNTTTDKVEKEWKNLGKAQDMVLENANNAYKTAGMNANEYMETATSFSAALIKGLKGDTIEAARLTDVAMVAMSDNINTFGTDAAAVQNAFQGFAKQNYTMLDNLKLGYGGTKQGMVDLIKDSGILGKEADKLTAKNLDEKVSFDKIVEAIQAVQEQQNIAGTTAREASTTISGSFGMLKAAWENLVTGFASPDADIGALIGNVMQSVFGYVDEGGQYIKGFLDNIVPAVKQALEGIGKFLDTALPDLLKKIPDELGWVLPMLLESASNLVGSLVKALPTLIAAITQEIPNVISSLTESIIESGPTFVDSVNQIFDMIVNGINTAIPMILTTAPKIIGDFITGITESLPMLAESGFLILENLSTGIMANFPVMVSTALSAIESFSASLAENSGMLIDAGLDLLMSLMNGIINSLPIIIDTAFTVIDNFATAIGNNLPKILQAGGEIIQKLAQGLINAAPVVISNATSIMDKLLSYITSNAPKFLDDGIKLITNLANGLLKSLPTVMQNIGKIISSLLEFILSNAPVIAEKGMQLIINLAQGLLKALPNIIQSAVTIITGLINKIISHIPQIIETGFKLITQLALGLIKALPDIIKAALSLVKGIFDTITQIDWLSLGINIVQGIIDGVVSMGKAFLDAIVNLAKSAFQGIVDFFDIGSPSKKMRDEVGKNIVRGLIVGVNAEKKNAKKNAEQLGSLYISAAKSRLKALKAENKLTLEEQWAFWLEVRDQTKKGTKAYDEATVQIRKVIDEIEKAEDNYLKKRKEKLAYKKEIDGMTLAEEIAFWEKTRENLAKGSDAYKEATMEISSAKRELNTQLEALGNEYLEGVQKVSDELDSAVQALTDAYEKAVADRQKALMSQMSMFETFTPKEGKGKDDLIQSMISQVEGMAEYTSTMTALQARLGDTAPEFYEELKGMNVDQLETLKAISEMSDQELETYVGLYNAKQMMAKDRAVRDNEELKKQTDAQIEELKTNAQTQLDELEKKYKDGIKALGVNAKKEFKKAGKNAVKGMGEGMNTEFDKLETQMKARAAALVASIQAALKIHSPSKVFADEVGKFIPLGIAEGFEQAMPQAEKGIMSSVDDMRSTIAGELDFTGAVGDVKISNDNNNPVVMILMAIYDAVVGMPDDMRESFGDALRNTTFSMNDREFARLVKAV